MSKRKKISIVGFGRFGQLLASILVSDFIVQVYDTDESLKQNAINIGAEFCRLDELLRAEMIFYCVPISHLQQVIIDHLPIYKSMSGDKLIIDVSSVKSHPKKILEELLPTNYQILLTHPMFGPDSVGAKGLYGQTIVIDKCRTSEENFLFWKDYFINKELNVVEMSADEHDRLAAMSQGVTHIIGRLLDEVSFKPTPIDTLGTKKLYEIKEQTCNDSWQLFVDLQTFNPYTRKMHTKLATAFEDISSRLFQV